MLESLPPVFLSFLSGVFLAATQTIYRGALQWIGPKAITFVTNLTLVTYASTIYILGAGLEKWPLAGVFWFVLAGLCSHFLSRNLNFISATLIGMARSQIFLQVHPIWSALLAMLLFGETMNFPIALGTFAIVLGAILLVQERGAGGKRAPFLYYLLPILAAFFFSFAPPLRKLAFQTIPSPAFGIATTAFTGALLQLGSIPFVENHELDPRTWNKKGLCLVLIGGIFNIISAYAFWLAIKNGKLIEVIPMNRLSILFLILFSWVFYQRLERINLRVIAGGLLAVEGAVLILLGR